MNTATMDHMHASDKLKKRQPKPETRSGCSALKVVAVVLLALAGTAYAVSRVAEHRLGSTIYKLTDQAIATEIPACEVETVEGIRVLHCIQTIAQ